MEPGRGGVAFAQLGCRTSLGTTVVGSLGSGLNKESAFSFSLSIFSTLVPSLPLYFSFLLSSSSCHPFSLSLSMYIIILKVGCFMDYCIYWIKFHVPVFIFFFILLRVAQEKKTKTKNKFYAFF